ncbi:MAG: 3-deoxy-manno-octulosonate cytidylyltransferase (CMP-KDO synthetase) [Bradymonadia bacterium]|jgi:3-deoxy-manno-octulosonate cytidylyltransferase (CMP-KDO synthetase)
MKAGRITAIIPARAGSRRLPDKPLCHLSGLPLICHVVRSVRESGCVDAVYVACDDARIEAAVIADGGHAVRVDRPCSSGTQRIAHALELIDSNDELASTGFVLNVQGDEPFVSAEALHALVDALRAGACIATLAAPLDPAERTAPNVVKVVRAQDGRALYFSRAAIPGERHVGLYGFTVDALRAVAHLPRGPLSVAEDLEQLAWLEAGWPIAVAPIGPMGPSIDTPADLVAAEAWLAARQTPRSA